MLNRRLTQAKRIQALDPAQAQAVERDLADGLGGVLSDLGINPAELARATQTPVNPTDAGFGRPDALKPDTLKPKAARAETPMDITAGTEDVRPEMRGTEFGKTSDSNRFEFFFEAADAKAEDLPALREKAVKIFGRDAQVSREHGYDMDESNPGVMDRVMKGLEIENPKDRQAYFKEHFRDFVKVDLSPEQKAILGVAGGGGFGRQKGYFPKRVEDPPTPLPDVSHTKNPISAKEFAKMPDEGTVNPVQLRTMQNNAKNQFKNDQGSIEDMANGLKSGSIKPKDIPPVRISEINGEIFTLDHRRVIAFREAGVPIRYMKATPIEVRRAMRGNKMSTQDTGTSIKIKNRKDSADD